MPKTKKIWVKAESWVTKATLEVAQNAFLLANAIGIEIDDGIVPEGPPKYDDDRILLKAYFEVSDADPRIIQRSFDDVFVECGLVAPPIDFADFVEEDWQGNFVKSCTTFKVEPDIYIVPSFEIDAFTRNPRGPLFIEMDPENAFGTGQHQTTKLCLTALYHLLDGAVDARRARCLDVGTGSGILAILMKKRGALSVMGTETDEDALETARRNAIKNGAYLDTLVVSETHHYDEKTYDLVVANILAPVLIAMAANLSLSLRDEGHLVLSGILLSQAQTVIDAFVACGLRFVQQTSMDDWCALLFRREKA